MNERIQQLAEQAGAKFPFGGFPNYDCFDCEQFAELIVLECADFIGCGEFGDPGMANELKKYFGVER